jgi:hypothetical protein
MKSRRLSAGLLFACGALLCGLVALYSSIKAAGRVRGLTPVTAVALENTQLGEEVLIEARVSSRNTVRYRPHEEEQGDSLGFVAYIRERRAVDEDDDTGNWSVSGRVTPPLILELPDGLVQIENDDYELQDAHVVEEERASGEPSTTRYKGFAVGDPVVAVGVLTSRAELPQIEADFVARGTRESYIARRRSSGTIFCIASVVVAALGGLILMWDRVRGLFPRRF